MKHKIPNYKIPGRKWGKLHAIGLENYFIDMTTKLQVTKAKMDKQDNIKLKAFGPAKETINKKQKNKQTKKQTKIPTQYKSGQRTKMDIYPENVKRCLTSLIIREIQVKTKMRHHLLFARMAIAEKEKNISLNNLLFYSFQFSTGSPVTKDRLTRKEQTNYLKCIFT